MLTGLRLRYDEIEDRVVLKTTTRTAGIETELCLMITRRACIAWRADLSMMTRIAQREPQSVFTQARAAIRRASGVGTATAEASTPTESRPPNESAPRSSPIRHLLVTSIDCARRRGDGSWLIKFKLKDHPMLTLVLTDESLQRTATGLDKLLPRCNWALPPVKATGVKKTAGNSGPLH